jgi:hypothetical protein
MNGHDAKRPPVCCGQPVKMGSKKENGKTVYGMWCPVCGKSGKADTMGEAERKFRSSAPVNSTAIMELPGNPGQLPEYMQQHMTDLISRVSPVVEEKPAMVRLIKNNIRYLQNADQLKKAWGTEDGIRSIIKAGEDALELGAELGKMGDLLPYGDVCEFIPAVEAYEFALTNGANAPFEWIKIEPIYKNDIIKCGRKDGNFFLDFENFGSPRGAVRQIAVYGKASKSGLVIGELYDAERLLEKMKNHSASYRYYLQDKQAAEVLRTEGKLKSENGREYFEKEMFKRGGGSWVKKIYVDEISNPYEGADQPEMLRKAAGKSFLRKYARVRNAEAALAEMREAVDTSDDGDLDSMIDASIDAAMEQFPDGGVDYEVMEEEPKPVENREEEKKSEQVNEAAPEKKKEPPKQPNAPEEKAEGVEVGQDDLF